MVMQRTFVMIKPDGVKRGLIGEIISRFEKRGLKIVSLKMVKMSRDIAEKLYDEHKGKSFLKNL
jgi:nucleoside diphosphate kinase (EC 2.7.4.6)